jgi:hypothetical protein
MTVFRRRVAGLLLTVPAGLALVLGPGCESLNLRRPKPQSDDAVTRAVGSKTEGEAETDKILDVQSDPAKPQKFFRSNRLSGALSDDGREIERHLGIQ